MARGGRRYARDSRGRFASVGATARGGRIAKASGKRATVTAKATGGGKGAISKPRGLKPGAIKPKAQLTPKQKPVGWAQNQKARADRVEFAGERKREAAFMKSLSKPTRKAINLANKSRNRSVGAKAANGVNEGATLLRANFGKRRSTISPNRAAGLSAAIQYSGRRLKIALAEATVGRRLTPKGDERKRARTMRRRR